MSIPSPFDAVCQLLLSKLYWTSLLSTLELSVMLIVKVVPVPFATAVKLTFPSTAETIIIKLNNQAIFFIVLMSFPPKFFIFSLIYSNVINILSFLFLVLPCVVELKQSDSRFGLGLIIKAGNMSIQHRPGDRKLHRNILHILIRY